MPSVSINVIKYHLRVYIPLSFMSCNTVIFSMLPIILLFSSNRKLLLMLSGYVSMIPNEIVIPSALLC